MGLNKRETVALPFPARMQTKGVVHMATTNVSIRMEENLKKQAETIFDEMGMNMYSTKHTHPRL